MLTFVAPYLSKKDTAFFKKHAGELDLKHLDYDWSLNDTRRGK